MIYIDGLGYVDESTYTPSNKTTTSTNNFDDILQKETTIYAVPENSAQSTTSSVGATQTVIAPQEMEQYFQDAASTYNIDINLLKAMAKQESNFDPNVVSSAGAIGVMQLTNELASEMGVTDPYNAQQNIMGGAKYMASLLERYDNDITLALAAYNAGPGNVEKYGGVPPFKETQTHIQKVLGYMGTDITIPTVTSRNTSALSDNNDNVVNTIYAVAAKDIQATSKSYTINSNAMKQV